MSLQEILRRYPDLSVRNDSEFLQDAEGLLYVKTRDKLLCVKATDGGFVIDEIKSTRRKLNPVRNLTSLWSGGFGD